MADDSGACCEKIIGPGPHLPSSALRGFQNTDRTIPALTKEDKIMKRQRATNTRFEKVGNLPCAIVICEDGSEVMVPAEIFVALAARARQFLQSTRTPTIAGEWIAARYHNVSQIKTGRTDTGRVALQLDPGTDSEICIALEAKMAKDLGQYLIDAPVPDTPGKVH